MSTIKSDSIQPTLGTNNLILKTGSSDVERLRISPSGVLTVSSTVSSTFSGSLTVSGASNFNGKLAIGSAVSGTPNVDLEVVSASNSGLLDPQLNTFTTTRNRANASIRASAGNTTLFFGNSGVSAAWLQVQNSDNTQRSLALNPVGGSVVVGATVGIAPLHVYGGPRFGSYAEIRLTDEYVSNASWGMLAQTGANTKMFRILDWSQNQSQYVDRFFIDELGHVGIGLTGGMSPQTYLNSTGSTQHSSILSMIGRATNLDSADGRIEFVNPITPASITTSTTFGRIFFVAGGQTNVNKIKAAITCVSPSTGANGGGEINIFTNNGGTATTSETLKMTIARTGVITFHSYGAGTLTTSATGVISASDGRHKTKTRSLDSGLDKVSRLLPTYYRWNDDSPFAHPYEELGFVAQEVAAVIPEASPEPETAEKFKNYSDRAIIAVLVKSVQELKGIVDAQAAEIAELKAK